MRARLAELLDAELGILPEEADLLVRLAEAPEQRLRMADVSRSLRLSKSGVTRLVDRLAERGLVVRAAVPERPARRLRGADGRGPAGGRGRGSGPRGRRGAAARRPSLARGSRPADGVAAPARRHRGGRRLTTARPAPDHSSRLTLEQTMATRPDLTRADPPTLDAGTDIGHVHLKVSDLDRALAFYQGVLGFELTGTARRPGRLRLRGRLPPPHRPEHLGVARRLAAAARDDRPLPRRHPLSDARRRWRARCAR